MKKITVIGSGTMGNGIAHTFAQFEHQVNLVDISEKSLEKAIVNITKNLDRPNGIAFSVDEKKESTDLPMDLLKDNVVNSLICPQLKI